MHQGRSNHPEFQMQEKALSTAEIVSCSGKLSSTRKREQSLFRLLLEIESRRQSTISPVIASSRAIGHGISSERYQPIPNPSAGQRSVDEGQHSAAAVRQLPTEWTLGCRLFFSDEDLALASFRWAHAQSAFFGP